ncbi:MAG: ATP-binding protein [Planctomycetota bacterium]
MTQSSELPDATIPLTLSAFTRCFPFGFYADGAGNIVALGSALARRLSVVDGLTVDALVEVQRPRRTANLVRFALEDPRAEDMLVTLKLRHDGLCLKGQLTRTAGAPGFIFIGSTLVQNVEELRSSGLQLKDFAPHDATPDMLLMLQANMTSLNDARKLAAELAVSVDEARTAAEAKGRFLAVMSHEIRTPMNGFGSMIDLLLGTALDPAQREAVDVIDECATALGALLNDILDHSKIEAGAIELERVAFDPRSACEGVLRLFRRRATEKGLDLCLEVAPEVPGFIRNDPARFRQVVSNLVGNALKFTEVGEIVVHVSAPREGRLLLAVQDTGPGVPEAVRPMLFQPFSQGDSSTTRRYGGTGLGLTICRQLAQLMGGDARLARSDSSGSTFELELEAPRAEAAASDRALELELNDLRALEVLVAEDNPTNRLIIARLLARLDVVATIVEDGQRAVEAVRQRAFDLILMDLGMPELDGVGAARAIRALEVPHRDLPIVAFSAGAFAEDREAARAAGMNGFLTKPVRLVELARALRQHRAPEAERGDSAVQAETKKPAAPSDGVGAAVREGGAPEAER